MDPRKVKVLPLDSWMVWGSDPDCWEYGMAREDLEDFYTPVTPVFNRPGRYLLRAQPGQPHPREWFELPNGEAWEHKRTHEHGRMFLHRIHTEEASRLMPEQVLGLQAICKTRLATRRQRSLLGHWAHSQELINLGRDALLTCQRALGRKMTPKKYPPVLVP